MIHIDPLLITPLTYAAISLPITWIIGKIINPKFSTLLISLFTAFTFSSINYLQSSNLELAAQLGLLILGAAALIKLGIGIAKFAITAISLLIIIAFMYSQRKAIIKSAADYIRSNTETYKDAEDGSYHIKYTSGKGININLKMKKTDIKITPNDSQN